MRALIVGTDPDARERYGEILRFWRNEIEVIHAEEPEEVDPEVVPNIIFIDARNLEVSASLVTASLRTMWQESSFFPYIIVFGEDDTITAAGSLDAGADDYMRVPFHASELVARLNAFLRRESDKLQERRRSNGR